MGTVDINGKIARLPFEIKPGKKVVKITRLRDGEVLTFGAIPVISPTNSGPTPLPGVFKAVLLNKGKVTMEFVNYKLYSTTVVIKPNIYKKQGDAHVEGQNVIDAFFPSAKNVYMTTTSGKDTLVSDVSLGTLLPNVFIAYKTTKVFVWNGVSYPVGSIITVTREDPISTGIYSCAITIKAPDIELTRESYSFEETSPGVFQWVNVNDNTDILTDVPKTLSLKNYLSVSY